jgi:hypothetical protein
MTSELETLRSLADRVHPPALEALEEVARRRTRRTAAMAALGCALSVLVVAFGIAVATTHDDHSAPRPVLPPTPTPTVSPSPTPTSPPTHSSHTSMTPEEVVLADNATLEQTAVSADDPDFRFSVWMAECTWCPKPYSDSRFPHPWFGGLALTTDGFQTATYRHAPWQDCRFTQPCGSNPVHVESVGPGMLLVVDDSNGYEWLVRDDGTITTLARDFSEVPAADPRLWFACLATHGHSSGGAPDDDAVATWCALDPKANRLHIWEGPWSSTLDDTRSVVSPDAAVPWGFRDPTNGPGPGPADPGLSAWWESGGSRQYHDLSDAEYRGAIGNPPPGLMSYWSWSPGTPTMQVFTSSDGGASWRTTELGLGYRPGLYSFDVYWTPGGDLLARQNDAFHADGSDDEGDGLRILRADFEAGGAFTPVYEARTGNLTHWEDLPFSGLGDRIWASNLWSDDDGRTWSEETTWRP